MRGGSTDFIFPGSQNLGPSELLAQPSRTEDMKPGPRGLELPPLVPEHSKADITISLLDGLYGVETPGKSRVADKVAEEYQF